MENMDVSRQKENVEYQRECQELRAELIHTKRELHKMNEVFERENMNFSEWNISIEDQFFNTHTESENSKTVLEQLKELSEEKSSLEIQVESLSVQLENMRNNQSKDIPLTSQLLQQEFSLLREEFNGIITTNLNMLLENDQLKKKHQIEIDINVGLIKTVQKSNEMYKELKQEHRRFKDRTHRIKDHQDDLRDLVEKLEDERRFLQDQMVLLKKNLKRSEHDAHQELQKERAWGRQMEEEANDFGKLTLAAKDRILILETENRKMMEKNTDLLNEQELAKSQHILVSNLLKNSEIEANQRIEDQKKSDATRDRWKKTAKSSIEKMILANKNISEQALEIKKLKKMLQSPNPVALVPRVIRKKSGISKKADSQPVVMVVTRAMKRKRISSNIENLFEVTNIFIQ